MQGFHNDAAKEIHGTMIGVQELPKLIHYKDLRIKKTEEKTILKKKDIKF